MQDLMTRLTELASTPEPAPSETVVAADLARARAALRQRRRWQVPGAALTAVAVAGSLGYLSTGQDSRTAPSAGTSVGPRYTSPTAGPAAIQLVDYTGPQPSGFTIARIPVGFVDLHVRGGSRPGTRMLVIAPRDRHTAGKLAISLLSPKGTAPKGTAPKGTAPKGTAPKGTAVTVNGRPGVIEVRPSDGAELLLYSDGRHKLEIRSSASIGLTNDQLVAFAEGVTVRG